MCTIQPICIVHMGAVGSWLGEKSPAAREIVGWETGVEVAVPDNLRDLERELMVLTRRHVFPGPARHPDARTLERSAYVLLSRIEASGPMTIGQLADAFCLDVSTVNRQAAAMLAASLVERIPDPDGGMARKLAITAEGARRLDADRAVVLDKLGGFVDGWTDDEVRSLADMLSRFNVGIERLEGRPWPRPERVASSAGREAE